MDSGFYAVCAGMKAQSQMLEMVANNLANVNTSGFRAEQPTFRSLLAAARPARVGALNSAINDFEVLGSSAVQLSPGSVEHTGNPLDFAIGGKGFFAVQSLGKTVYTRNGQFHLSADRRLTTAQGDPVLGEQGPIVVPPGAVSVSADGTLSVNGAVAGKLKMEEFGPGTALEPAGSSYYAAPAGAGFAAVNPGLQQGSLESSNVNPVTAVVDLISVQRHAELLQRTMAVFYSEFNRVAVEDLPRV